MSQTIMEKIATAPRREDFPVEVFRYLEGKLQKIRNNAARLAADIACGEQPMDEVYRVEKAHVDAALLQLLRDTKGWLKELGLAN